MTERNADVSKTLTEKWKKGELPEGLYWVKHDGVINILDNLEIALTNVDKVLAPVPTYHEYISMNNIIDNVLKENTKLKELLKQYKEDILNDCDWYIDAGEKIRQIDQVLGEE